MMRVIFVDDEPNVLHGLRRTLRPLCDKWDMAFFTNGNEALEHLSTAACDVVVSDMKMPVMDGAEFLSLVRERMPGTIRIALSGETDRHMVYRCVQHAHQYIAKPCSRETLVATVQRAANLRDLMKSGELQALVSQLTTLPSLPEQYQKIMAELQREEPSMQKVACIVESDVAMTAKILQLVNSAFFGLVRPIGTMSEAVMYLGLDVIRTLVLSTGVFSQLQSTQVEKTNLRELWGRSMLVASLAKEIGRNGSIDGTVADLACMGGMLSEIGNLVLAVNMSEQYRRVAERLAVENQPPAEIEREEYGHTHEEVGAYLAGLWGLPNPVVECVAFAAEPARCSAESFTPVCAVHVAACIVKARDRGAIDGLDTMLLDRLGMLNRVPEWVAIYEKQLADNRSRGNE